MQPLYIAPGAPWENSYAESFIGRVQDELSHCEVFTSLLEAQVVAEDWRVEYNEGRPHGALGYMTPKEFAAMGKQAAFAPLQAACLPVDGFSTPHIGRTNNGGMSTSLDQRRGQGQ